MKEVGLIESAQGARGGYLLQRKLDEITLVEFLELMEGPQSVVACTSYIPAKMEQPREPLPESCQCAYSQKCEIQGLMSALNTRVHGFLAGIRLADLDPRAQVMASSVILAEEP
jgi:DNA-binding IscR family transcriptional regulator